MVIVRTNGVVKGINGAVLNTLVYKKSKNGVMEGYTGTTVGVQILARARGKLQHIT